MNILIPDMWLRDFLQTEATPKQLKEYLSLCGPSIERINEVNGETVYDIEITGNRTDAMSVVGVAREASVILPRFGIPAQLMHDPYAATFRIPISKTKKYPLTIHTDETLTPRYCAVVIEDIHVQPSPEWLAVRLEQVGIRPLNNVIDISNYLMHAFGMPIHAFDYKKIGNHTMTIRRSITGESVTTLDGKPHDLGDDDIVIADGDGKLIDLCGIMGGDNSKIDEQTTAVVWFVPVYDPSHIRKTSMRLAARSDAAGLFEKGIDQNLAPHVMMQGIAMLKEICMGTVAGPYHDFNPTPKKPITITVSQEKLATYLGMQLPKKDIHDILTSLGCMTTVTEKKVTVKVPTYRKDMSIDVDIIEEIARIYGYHNMPTSLPSTEPPLVLEDPMFHWEQVIKQTLCDLGYTEFFTYSMISEELMQTFHIDKDRTYRITNPLSSEWIYMRPMLVPSVLMAVKQNLNIEPSIAAFELRMTYQSVENDLPREVPTLTVILTGKRFSSLKGLSEMLFRLFGIPYPSQIEPGEFWLDQDRSLKLGTYGSIGEMDRQILAELHIQKPITILNLSVAELLAHADFHRQYIPIPKYPASYEDLAFVVGERIPVGPMIETIRTCDPIISDVTLFDSYENIRTFHITYQSNHKNLTAEDTQPIRKKIISTLEKLFDTHIKTTS